MRQDFAMGGGWRVMGDWWWATGDWWWATGGWDINNENYDNQ